jgi:hypothetical protein
MKLKYLIIVCLLLVGCIGQKNNAGSLPSLTDGASTKPAPTTSPEPMATHPRSNAATATAEAPRLWISAGVPDVLLQRLNLPAAVQKVGQAGQANLRLEPFPAELAGSVTRDRAVWIYALVAPFPTVIDGVALDEIKMMWRGEWVSEFNGHPLLMTSETRAAFETYWGAAAKASIKVVAEDKLLDTAWNSRPSWAIVPFEDLSPRWKVLRVNGVSPLDKDFDPQKYPLAVTYGLMGNEGVLNELSAQEDPLNPYLPPTNRDPAKLTVLLLTGTTALVRGTALEIEDNGVDYPASSIMDWFKSADLIHISNEVPFYTQCPPAKPIRKEMRFCSDPSYFGLLKYIGANIIELTGNHELDWGPGAFQYTLKLYKDNSLPYYGGGQDLNEARQPLEVDHNGNRLVFIGCNMYGPAADWATAVQAGANPCGDLAWMEDDIKQALAEGKLPVVTFQHFEVDDYTPQSAQRIDFQHMATDGALIVSGSQAHFPQAMIFIGANFVHYGLGNLFFDQMAAANRRLFVDRHVFYDGHYISIELLTAMLEDGARPRPMTVEERKTFLEDIFKASGW